MLEECWIKVYSWMYVLSNMLHPICNIIQKSIHPFEVVYVTVGNLAFCLFLYLTVTHFRGELQHVGDIIEQKFKC